MGVPVKGKAVESSWRSRWLGRQLRALRQDRGLRLSYMARQLGLDFSTVNASEHGLHVLPLGEVNAWLDVCGPCSLEERNRLLSLARDARQFHRWESHLDAPPLSLSMLDVLWLESHSQRIYCYGATLVPDLLQLPAYAEAVARRDGESTVQPEQVAWWGWACRERQGGLDGVPQANLHAVLAESVLHRPVGGSSDLLGQQLQHLADACDQAHIELQVLPAGAEYRPGMDGSFTAFELTPPDPVVACAQSLTGPVIHEDQPAGRYAEVHADIAAVALSPADSRELIARAVKAAGQ